MVTKTQTCKVLIGGLLSLLLASGCTSQSATDGKIAAKEGRIGGTNTGSQKPSEEQSNKPTEDKVPVEVKNLLTVLTQAHQIHRQIWFKLAATQDDRGSAFKQIGAFMNAHRGGPGGWSETFSNNCKPYQTRIIQNGSFAKKEQVLITFQVNPGCTNADKDFETWASFGWGGMGAKGTRQLRMEFARGLMQGGFGTGLSSRALIGDKDSEGKETAPKATCNLEIEASSNAQKIKSMTCEGLGQNISATSYIEMKTLEYSAEPFPALEDYLDGEGKVILRKGSKMVARVEALQVTQKDGLWKDDRKFLMPIPEVGKIVMLIDLLSLPAGDAYEKAKTAAEANPQATENRPDIQNVPVEDPNTMPADLQPQQDFSEQGKAIDPNQTAAQEQEQEQAQGQDQDQQYQQQGQQLQYQQQEQTDAQQVDPAQAQQPQVAGDRQAPAAAEAAPQVDNEEDEMNRNGFSLVPANVAPAHGPVRGTAQVDEVPSYK